MTYMTTAQVLALLAEANMKISRRTLHVRIAKGFFPRPEKRRGTRDNLFVRTDVEKYISGDWK